MTVFLNGEFMPIEQARVPVLDRGFIFGDGVYEMIPVYSGMPFRLKEHLVRLGASLASVRIENPYDEARWAELIRRVVHLNAWDDQSVYLQITRGVAPRDHSFKPLTPTVLIMSSPLSTPSAAQVRDGVSVITHPDFRWTHCDIKSTSLLANCMLRTLATEAGCAETLLLRDGQVTEASASNVFIVAGGIVVTPPKSNLMLPGITYDVVLELLRDNGIAHELRPVAEVELRSADEIWITSSSREVLAVTGLDSCPVGRGDGAGRPGPVFRRVHALYQEYKSRVMRAGASELNAAIVR
jgi:D-alanine transaminase